MAQVEYRTEQSFLPDFCGVRTLFAVVVSTTVLAMVLALAATDHLQAFWENFSMGALYVQWIGLMAATFICVLRRWLGKLSHGRAGLVAWLLIMLAALLVSLIAGHLIPMEYFPGVSLGDLMIRTLGISGILGALILRYLYENHQQKQKELAESRARFQALQARIRPHFLFNSLNTVISLIPQHPGQAEEVLQDLADLFRASLGDESRMSSVGREMELTRQYLAVEQQRLGSRLRITWSLEDLPEDAPMPALLLQPLVENAVYHGIEPAVHGGEICIFGRYRNNVVALTVSNTLAEQDAGVHRQGNHMALENIRQRLAVRFGEEAGMHTGMVEDRYQVRIWFPVKGEKDA
ncbi:sensor histidine kinase [Thiolapillus brandeum]|uniref:Two-component system LytT family sensor histidine kinase AlgZ n=1 Tax=Thiolapillus brandeum TaxID=1076588 RepID=A0A7U6JIM5_9GAMM|nr:histidine kinase [Thiolapillus brandeum]BAO45456.1 two-component system LytT family sensor histidine kinase AlgZ [Thiolapillus brandeum]